MSRNFYVRTCVKFTFANKIEAMHERSLVSVKVEPRSTSRLSSARFICLYFIYIILKNLCALTCVAKNASVEINLKANNTFLNSLTNNEVEAQVEFMLKVMERARVTFY